MNRLLRRAAALLAAVVALATAQPAAAGERVLVLLRMAPTHFRGAAAYSGGYGDAAAHAGRRRIAERIARRNGLSLATDWPMPLVGLDCFVMDVPAGRSAETVAAEVARDRAVAWSEPMHAFRAQAAAPPDDPMFPLQPAAREWRLAELHEIATGRGVRVAVVDSAVDAAHPDLAGQVAVRQDFTEQPPSRGETHGTSVAGVIAAIAGNHLGVAGVAPGARLMGLRACWQEAGAAAVCDTLSLAKALHFAADARADVINLSLAGPNDRLLGQLIDAARARGAVVVGAVDPALPGGGFPASHPGVVPVASTPDPGAYVAPGRDIPTTLPGARYSLVNGSSYSAAHVSGLYALLRERGAGVRRPAELATGPGGVVDPCASLARSGAPCCGCAPKGPRS